MLQNYFTDIDIQDSYITIEPISLAEAKQNCLITHTEDDTYIQDILIPACRNAVEDYCHVSIIDRNVTVTLKIENNIRLIGSGYLDMPDNVIELPYGPIKTDPTVTQLTSNGNITNLSDNDGYQLTGTAFKSIALNQTGTYILVYGTGYKQMIPRDLKLAILNEIAFRYEKRGDESKRYSADTPGICAASQALADKHRRLWV